MQRDQLDAKKVMEVVQNWCDSFEGWYAGDQKHEHNLLGVNEKGKKILISFMTGRLQPSNVRFYEILSKLKLGTFHNVLKFHPQNPQEPLCSLPGYKSDLTDGYSRATET